MPITFRKQRKRGGYPSRPHRKGPGTFIIHYLAWKYRFKRPKSKMYDTVEACIRAEGRHW
jgi:hypothetical protein